MLSEDKRQQLDSIVQDMVKNNESDFNVQFVVDDFKKKYDEPENISQTPKTPLDVVKKGYRGLIESAEKRADKVGDILKSDQTLVSKGKQVFGQGAGLGAEIIGRGATTALSLATPDAIEEPIKKEFENVVSKALGTEAAQKTIDFYRRLKQQYPEAVGNFEAFLNVLDLATSFTGAKVGTQAVAKSALKSGKIVGKGALKTAKTSGSIGKTATSLGTGLERSTIEQVIKTPGIFTKKEMARIDRDSLFKKIQDAVDKRLTDLSEIGKGYEKVRKTGGKVSLPDNFLKNSLKKFGFEIKDGAITPSTKSVTRQQTDINALQNFYDSWKGKTEIDADEFLNMRSDLSELSKFDKISGKTKASETIAKSIREKTNEFRNQIKGLSELDKKYSPEKEFLGKVKKELFEKDGTLKSNALSKVANLTGKGKERLLGRLEKIVPGIREDVNILKAIEDIEVAKGKKVGTYLRGATGGFVVSGGNPVATVIAAIATSPQVAVPLIRAYGKLKEFGKPLIEKTIEKLKNGSKLVGKEYELVDGAIKNASKKVTKRIGEVSKNKPAGLSLQEIKAHSRGGGKITVSGYKRNKMPAKEKLGKIAKDDQNVMADFTDYVAGEMKLSEKDARDLTLDASRIAEHYNLKMPKTEQGLANSFGRILELLDFKR